MQHCFSFIRLRAFTKIVWLIGVSILLPKLNAAAQVFGGGTPPNKYEMMQVVVEEVDYVSIDSTVKYSDRLAPASYSLGALADKFVIYNLPFATDYGDVRIDFAPGGSDALRQQCLDQILAQRTQRKLEALTGTPQTSLLIGGRGKWKLNTGFSPPLLEITFAPVNSCSLGPY